MCAVTLVSSAWMMGADRGMKTLLRKSSSAGKGMRGCPIGLREVSLTFML